MSLIEKGAPTPPSFEEQMRAAEAEAGVPPDEELYSEYAVSHPEPDETGRVPASKPAEEPAVEAAPEAEAEAEPEAEQPEVDQLGEVNKKLGQLLNENAELRRQQAEWEQQQQQQQYTPPPATAPYSANDFESLLEQDPAQATILAQQANDQIGFQRAVQAWNEVSPGAPRIWWDNQMLRAELHQLREGVNAQVAPAQEMAHQTQLQNALTNVMSRHEDFGQVIGTLDEAKLRDIATAGLPLQILEQGLAGDQRSKEQVFETIYRWVKADQTGTLVQAAQEAPARQAEEARQAKREATVASATTTTPETPPQTEEERMTQVFKEYAGSMRDHWEGRNTRSAGR